MIITQTHLLTALETVQQPPDLQLLPLGRLKPRLLLVPIGIQPALHRIHPRVVIDIVGIGIVLGMRECSPLQPPYQFDLPLRQRHLLGVEGIVDGKLSFLTLLHGVGGVQRVVQ